MCSPAIIPIVTATSAALSAYGVYQQNQFQQGVANANATTELYKADQTRQLGAMEADQHRAKVRQLIGTQVARQGASGVEAGSGTFGKILDQTATFGEMDARTIYDNALRTARGYETQALSDKASADMYGKAAVWNTAGTLLGSTGRVYGAGQTAGWWK